MKKFLVFVVSIISIIGYGQDPEERVINSADFPVALYSGIPDIKIPLFDLQTKNSNFSPNITLENNFYASTSKHFSAGGKSGIGDAWSMSIVASISATGVKEGINGSNWYVFDETLYSRALGNGMDYNGQTIYNFSVFGLSGKFVIVKDGLNFYPVIIEKNDYVEVLVDYSISGNLFRINSFTIKDKNGFSYLFNEYDTANNPLTYKDKTNFYINKIIDKYNNDLLIYAYTQGALSSINVVDKGTITLSPPNVTKRTITYNDAANNRNQKVELSLWGGFPPFNKVMLTQVKLFSNDDSKTKSYNISYKRYLNTNPANTFYGFLHTACAYRDLTSGKILFDHGAVEKITTSEGATTFYEYEPNTVGFDVSDLTVGGTLYNETLKKVREANIANYTFEQIPLVYNSTYGGYLVDLSDYFPFTTEREQILYVEYKTNQVEIFPPSPFLPNGKYHTPLLQVGKYFSTPSLGSNPITISQITCNPGEPIQRYDNEKFLLKIEPQYQSYYQYIRAYYKKYKPDNELNFFAYSLGARIKRIKTFSENTTSINDTNNVAQEQLFSYENPTQPNSSSGYSKYYYFVNSNIEESIARDYKLYNYTDLTLYENVTVETPGKGKTQFKFSDFTRSNSLFPPDAIKAKQPERIEKYNATNQLIESITFERTYDESPVIINDTERHAQPILINEHATAQSFENGSSQGFTTTTESTFDPLTRNLTKRKITDAETQTFEEQYTYQKLGNAYYQTQVEKFKNNTPLNRSVFEYQQYGTSQAYNLIRTKVAKSTLPLEVEKEITSYDDFGNVLEYKTKDGMVVSQIWGYGNSKLVAELKNVSASVLYSSTYLTVRNNIANYSNQSGGAYSETNLTAALNSLRNSFPTSFITTYTYNPLVGITSITDANGRTETYQYDSFNRLYRVLNHEGLITKEYNYNIKN